MGGINPRGYKRLLTTSNTIVNQAVSSTDDALRISIRSV